MPELPELPEKLAVPEADTIAEWLFRLSNLVAEMDGLGYPLRVVVSIEPFGSARRYTLADLGNAEDVRRYPHGTRSGGG